MSKIASTYAQALFDAALESNVLEDIKNDFNVIRSVMKEQPQFMEILTLPKLDKNEEVETIIITLVDITERVHALELLKQSENKTKAIINDNNKYW